MVAYNVERFNTTYTTIWLLNKDSFLYAVRLSAGNYPRYQNTPSHTSPLAKPEHNTVQYYTIQ